MSESMNSPDSPFYLAIKYNRKHNDTEVCKKQPLGENILQVIIKNMAKQADLPGRKTNYSARKIYMYKIPTCWTSPNNNSATDRAQKCSEYNYYDVASNEMQKKMSNTL